MCRPFAWRLKQDPVTVPAAPWKLNFGPECIVLSSLASTVASKGRVSLDKHQVVRDHPASFGSKSSTGRACGQPACRADYGDQRLSGMLASVPERSDWGGRLPSELAHLTSGLALPSGDNCRSAAMFTSAQRSRNPRTMGFRSSPSPSLWHGPGNRQFAARSSRYGISPVPGIEAEVRQRLPLSWLSDLPRHLSL